MTIMTVLCRKEHLYQMEIVGLLWPLSFGICYFFWLWVQKAKHWVFICTCINGYVTRKVLLG
jgi:hypothetical protein